MRKASSGTVSVSFTVELGREEDEAGNYTGPWVDLTYEKPLPPAVAKEVEELVPASCEGLELDFDVEADISNDPGCRTMSNGDPGWPPSYSDERSVKGVYLLGVKQGPDGKRPKLSKETADILEGLYQEEINSADLPEQGYDGPDGDDY